MCTILAIESSCDETAAAIIQNGEILSNIIYSQEIHASYGGVVPELASRAHLAKIIPVIDTAIKTANISLKHLNAIAYTKGPGLMGALLVGASIAKSMSLALNIPLIGINHMQAHVLSLFLSPQPPKFPFLCLTVSGGHTEIIYATAPLEMEKIGATQDDAAGEALDKGAKLLGLPYPGGPFIDKYAQKGNPDKFSFPASEMPNFDYSFSGIKTSLLYFLREKISKNENFIKENLNDICASYQKTIIDMLLYKFQKAARHFKVDSIGIAGGVAANSELKRRLKLLAKDMDYRTSIPDAEYCTDNAAMIALAAHHMYKQGSAGSLTENAAPRLTL